MANAHGGQRGVAIRTIGGHSNIVIEHADGNKLTPDQRVTADDGHGATFIGKVAIVSRNRKTATVRLECTAVAFAVKRPRRLTDPITDTLNVTILDGGPVVDPVTVTYVDDPDAC